MDTMIDVDGTPSLLLLKVVVAGFDCSRAAAICHESYNMGRVVQKKTCPPVANFRPESKQGAPPYLPGGLDGWQKELTPAQTFDGDFDLVKLPKGKR